METVIRTPKTTVPTSLTASSWTLIRTGSGTSVMMTMTMMAFWMIMTTVGWCQTQTRRMRTVGFTNFYLSKPEIEFRVYLHFPKLKVTAY